MIALYARIPAISRRYGPTTHPRLALGRSRTGLNASAVGPEARSVGSAVVVRSVAVSIMSMHGHLGVHPAQVVTLHVADEDVGPRRKPEDQRHGPAHVHLRHLTDVPDGGRVLVDGEPVRPERHPARRPVGLEDHELVRGRPSIVNVERDEAGGE